MNLACSAGTALALPGCELDAGSVAFTCPAAGTTFEPEPVETGGAAIAVVGMAQQQCGVSDWEGQTHRSREAPETPVCRAPRCSEQRDSPTGDAGRVTGRCCPQEPRSR